MESHGKGMSSFLQTPVTARETGSQALDDNQSKRGKLWIQNHSNGSYGLNSKVDCAFQPWVATNPREKTHGDGNCGLNRRGDWVL